MIITCPACGTLGRAACETFAYVTCPRAACGHRFLAWPAGTQIDSHAELRERRFVCAVVDQPFWVVFGRRADNERFQVMKVHGQTGWLKAALDERQRSQIAQLKAKTKLAADGRALVKGGDNLPTKATSRQRARSLLSTFFAATPLPSTSDLAAVHWVRPTAEQVIESLAPRAVEADTLDFGEVDLTGWHCFHCEGEHYPRSSFVQCGRCGGELVCDGRSERKHDGTFFKCKESCGCEGPTVFGKILVGGDRHQVPQATGRDGLIGATKQTTIGQAQPRQLR